jgi:hypothetical protein
MLTIWFGGVRLTGAAAAFATWSIGATSGDGIWIGRGLPVGPVRLLFARNVSVQQISSGSLDGMASSILYPWASVTPVILLGE